MNYYGFIYQGNIDVYDMAGVTPCSDPYRALTSANRQWSKLHHPDSERLLIVFRAEEAAENADLERAYFQFTSEKACTDYVARKEEIKWSEEDAPKWNGDAHMMT